MEEDASYPCNDCEMSDGCDQWEAQFCCELCCWSNGGEQPSWCADCDPMDI